MSMTNSPDVPLPPGAVCTDTWEDGERVVQGVDRPIGGRGRYVVVQTAVVQRTDGSIVVEDGLNAPVISIATGDDTGLTDSGVNVSSEQARRLAEVLVEAADELDGWVGR